MSVPSNRCLCLKNSKSISTDHAQNRKVDCATVHCGIRGCFFEFLPWSHKELQENDLLVVSKIDRCSRNTLEFLKLQEELHQKGVRFISLDLPYSNDIAVNKLISTHLAAIATFENERRKERQRIGIEAAKKAGRYPGRKTVITKKLITEVQDLKENKNLSITQISKITGRGRNTIYKILKEELNYIPYNQLVKNVNQGGTNEQK